MHEPTRRLAIQHFVFVETDDRGLFATALALRTSARDDFDFARQLVGQRFPSRMWLAFLLGRERLALGLQDGLAGRLLYTRFTILRSLEPDVRPWIKPWAAERAGGRIARPLRNNGQPYSGINILILWAASVEQGFAAPIWMTFNQAHELSAHVKKGEKGSLVVYDNKITKTEDDGNDVEREIPFMKGYTVFNVEKIEGPKMTGPERIAHAEQFFANTGTDIRYRGTRAFYAIEPNYIAMPPIETFGDVESLYATLAHETTHWTRPLIPPGA